MNLTQLFDLSLRGRANDVALEFQGCTFTFGEIDDRSNRMASLLRERGLQVGDRLCVYLANCLELIDLYLACVKLGVIFVPINILYREREILHILGDAKPRAVIAAEPIPRPVETAGLTRSRTEPRASASRDTLHPGLEGIPFWRVDHLAPPATASRPEVALDGDAPAALVYTSGTTGVSKGAILTHNNFAANAISLVACWRISSADRFLLALPLFHVHALGNGLHCWLASGCRMRLLERFEHQKAAGEFLDFRPTLFFGVPTVYVRLLNFPTEVSREVGGFIRLFVSGSAPLPAQVFGEFEAKFGHRILERYGMTETLMNISNPYVGERRAGTVGFPLPGVSARIVNGEIHLRGPNIFAGYWGRDEATAAAFDDGWFKTGDMAERSADGYYTLLGRKSDLIISGGFNIYPREIEDFLLEQEEVAEAAVVGVADRLRGEVPVAYIVPRTPIEPAVLEARCRLKLASFKVPRGFVPVERLPRTALGKVQKHLLPEWKG
jgi:malonyl-CoA/methylmalonyl-CoA synthetase